jgi:hypothetical protein
MYAPVGIIKRFYHGCILALSKNSKLRTVEFEMDIQAPKSTPLQKKNRRKSLE